MERTLDGFVFALLVNVLCFVADPLKVLREAGRVLEPGGRIVVATIDRDTPLGKTYEASRESSRFYRHARFYSAAEAATLIMQAGFENLRFCQTIFSSPEDMRALDPVKEGYGKGAFLVIAASKPGPNT